MAFSAAVVKLIAFVLNKPAVAIGLDPSANRLALNLPSLISESDSLFETPVILEFEDPGGL